MKIKNSFLNQINSVKNLRRNALSFAILAILNPSVSLPNPNGSQVIGGNVHFDNSIFGEMKITNSPNAIINWQNFDIAQNEIVRFIQENGQSAVLNRVMGGNPSEILGQLYSNGKVFIINPNGIVFGAGAQIDTQGLIASSLNLSDDDFKRGNFHFIAGSKAGDITNEGIIHAGQDGNIVLISPNIENKGVIQNEGGQITLAAGQDMTMTSLDNPEMRFKVQAPKDKVLNIGQLLTDGGVINVFAGSIKQNSLIDASHSRPDANGIEIDKQGHIRLVARQDVTLSGNSKTFVDNSTGKGGKVEITAEKVAILNDSKVSASGEKGGGEILIGGDYQGKNPTIQNAKNTTLDKNTHITANSKTTGQGGKVIVWSDNETAAHGKVSAKGGNNSGNGGFVETSGHKLDTKGVRVDTSAPKGHSGNWLLDPYNITIVDDEIDANGIVIAANRPPFSTPYIPTQTSTIWASDIASNLNTGNVSITTAGGGADAGDITVAASITKTSSTPTSLSLIITHCRSRHHYQS